MRARFTNRTPEDNQLRVITCDQCGKEFMKRCSVHLRCSPECSRLANLESVRRWHVERGLRGVELGQHDCDRCGTRFKMRTWNQRFCTAKCRVLGERKLSDSINVGASSDEGNGIRTESRKCRNETRKRAF